MILRDRTAKLIWENVAVSQAGFNNVIECIIDSAIVSLQLHNATHRNGIK